MEDIGEAAGRVAAESAVGHRRRPGEIVVDAAPGGGRVAAESTVVDRKRRGCGDIEAGVVDPTSSIGGRVAADGAIAHRQVGVLVVDAAAGSDSRIAANCAVGDRCRRAAAAAPVVTYAAAVPGRVAAQSAVGHCQYAVVVEDAAADALNGRVATDCAAAQCQGGVIIIDAAAKIRARG